MRKLLSESTWLAPFLMMLLFAASLFRPEPETGPPAYDGETKTVTDAVGKQVEVPYPPVGVARPHQWRSYLPYTQKPELARRLGSRNELKTFLDAYHSWLFPEAAKDARLWMDEPGNTFEVLLATAPPDELHFFSFVGVDKYSPEELRDRFGILALASTPGGSQSSSPPGDPSWMKTTGIDADEYRMFVGIRVVNSAIDNVEFGETLITDFIEELRALHDGLCPETIPPEDRPRVMGMGAFDWSNIWLSSGDDARAATRGAIGQYRATGRYSDIERVLAINPDIIMGDPENLYKEKLWRGLTAVRERRVYSVPYSFGGYIWDIDHRLLNARFGAELFHPERYPVGELRELIRKRYRTRYRYEISDDQIDELLNVEKNSVSAGYERFMRDAK
jgi:hypothetical protein